MSFSVVLALSLYFDVNETPEEKLKSTGILISGEADRESEFDSDVETEVDRESDSDVETDADSESEADKD